MSGTLTFSWSTIKDFTLPTGYGPIAAVRGLGDRSPWEPQYQIETQVNLVILAQWYGCVPINVCSDTVISNLLSRIGHIKNRTQDFKGDRDDQWQ